MITRRRSKRNKKLSRIKTNFWGFSLPLVNMEYEIVSSNLTKWGSYYLMTKCRVSCLQYPVRHLWIFFFLANGKSRKAKKNKKSTDILHGCKTTSNY